ncbi:MAG: sigma-70 family RNA polymerase sigma factor [Verrucomicrobiaceae bacterium]|nr:sigma-70 family RNA polymerase sigma factor [Verrucomicrobiaceae bacterium]
MTLDFASQITGSQQRLYAYIRSLLDNSVSAWDVLQETNVVLWKKQAEFTPGTKFGAWAFTVARFQVMAYLRDRKREPLDVMTPELCELMAVDAAVEAAEFDHRLAALKKCREQLPERGRRLVELYYERGRSVKQVGDELKMGAEAVKQALFRLRRMLQGCIEGQTISPNSL